MVPLSLLASFQVFPLVTITHFTMMPCVVIKFLRVVPTYELYQAFTMLKAYTNQIIRSLRNPNGLMFFSVYNGPKKIYLIGWYDISKRNKTKKGMETPEWNMIWDKNVLNEIIFLFFYWPWRREYRFSFFKEHL